MFHSVHSRLDVRALDLFAKSPFDISGVVFFLYQTMTISSILFKNNQRNTNLIFKVPIAGEYVTQMTYSHCQPPRTLLKILSRSSFPQLRHVNVSTAVQCLKRKSEGLDNIEIDS